MAKHKMTTAELLALDVTVDIVTAGRAFGLGRSKSYELAQLNDFPCPRLKLGSRYVVTKAALLKALGVTAPEAQAAEQAEEMKAAS
jgi:hypothetical protein